MPGKTLGEGVSITERGREEWIQEDGFKGPTLGGVVRGQSGPEGVLGDGQGGVGDRGHGTRGPQATGRSWNVVCSRKPTGGFETHARI